MALLNLWSHPYELQSSSGTFRRGILLRAEYAELGFGYSSLQAWEEFGDLPLEKHVASLLGPEPTELGRMALAKAHEEAQARANKIDLLKDCAQVANNGLILDLRSNQLETQLKRFREQAFTHLKIKLRKPFQEDASQGEFENLRGILEAGEFKTRLDANSGFAFGEAFSFLESLNLRQRGQIEYFEDPCPFDPLHWRELRNLVPLGLDWESSRALSLGLPEECWDVLVIKPSRQDFSFWLNHGISRQTPMTITSAMDHPLGVLWALSKAQELKLRWPQLARVAGCQTLNLYQPIDFNFLISEEGSHIHPPELPMSERVGLGFGSLLESLDWVKVSGKVHE